MVSPELALSPELAGNREGLVNLRHVLFAAGEHPPPEPALTR